MTMSNQPNFAKIKYVYGWEFFSILNTYLMLLRSLRAYKDTHALRDDDEENLRTRTRNVRDHLRQLHRSAR